MTQEEFDALKPGDRVISKQYGISTIEQVEPDFGVVIQPDTIMGKRQLQCDSGAPYGTPLMETEPDELELRKIIP